MSYTMYLLYVYIYIYTGHILYTYSGTLIQVPEWIRMVAMMISRCSLGFCPAVSSTIFGLAGKELAVTCPNKGL